MAKDPAFLFYYQDFLVGTDHMTLGQIGLYIRLLCHQANRGSIRKSHIDAHMATHMASHEDVHIVLEKFKTDLSTGEYYNERLKQEMLKRTEYTASRIKNLNSKKNHMVAHMENENENINKGVKGESYPQTFKSYQQEAEKEYRDGKISLEEKNTRIRKWKSGTLSH